MPSLSVTPRTASGPLIIMPPFGPNTSPPYWGGALVCEWNGFLVDWPTTITGAAIEVVTSGGTIQVGLYDSTGTSGAPGNRLASSTAAACPAAGVNRVAFTSSITIQPGYYYVALACSAASPTVQMQSYYTAKITFYENNGARYWGTVPSGPALPATAPGGLTNDQGGVMYAVVPTTT